MKRSKKNKSSQNKTKKVIIPILIGTTIIGLSAVFIIQHQNKNYIDDSTKLFSGSIYTANFAANLLDTLDSNSNVLISPSNINTTLAIFYNAADNNTKKELKNYFKAEVDKVNEQYSSTVASSTEENENEYLSLYKEYMNEFMSSNYNNLTVNKINKLSIEEKNNLLVLIRQIEISYETSYQTTNYNVKSIKKYELTDEEKKLSAYKIKNKIDVIIDTWESLNITTKEINHNFIYYDNINIKDEFIKKVSSYYDVTFSALDLNNSTESRKSIIKDFKEITDEEIKNFVEEKDISNLSLISLNITYFNSEWETNIPKDNVKSTEFTNIDNTISAVDMMYEQQTSYLENDYAYGFVKDFKNQNYSFIGVIPKNQGEFQASSLDLNTLLDNEKYDDVTIGIPKFSYQSVINTSDIIENVGIDHLVSKEHNITKMTEDKTNIDMFKQIALINIAEKGTVSSSYSLSENYLNNQDNTKKIYLNRPFLFLIRNNSTNEIIMIGKVTKL